MLNERGITVRQALSMDVLKDARTLAGESGLERIITGINIMEVPDILDWVKSGELLVTTAYSIKDDKNALTNLIPALNAKGLAGIAIKTKRYISNIPDEILQAGDKLGFPIIELPYTISFSDVTSAILMEIFNKQAGILIKLEEVHEKLMNVVLSGGSLKEIGDALFEIIENPLVIKDDVFGKKLLICPEAMRHLYEPCAAALNEKSLFDSTNILFEESYKFVPERLGESRYNRFVFPIVAGQKAFGEIHVLETNKNINAVDIRAIQYACAIAALELMKQITVFEVEGRHKNEFLEGLLSPEPATHLSAVGRAEMFGVENNCHYMIFLMYIEEMDRYGGDDTIDNGTKHKNRLVQLIEESMRKNNYKVLLGYRGNTITLLVMLRHNAAGKSCKETGMNDINEIYRGAAKCYRSGKVFGGAGRCYSDIGEIWKSNEEAKKALSYSKIFRNDRIIHYDDLGILRLLCMEHQEQEIRKFCDETIMPLMEYDKNKNGELVGTLQAFFECGGNLKKVCAKMYIHYNTILYRIHKIQQITGMDLSDSNNRFNLEVSLKIMSLIEQKEY